MNEGFYDELFGGGGAMITGRMRYQKDVIDIHFLN